MRALDAWRGLPEPSRWALAYVALLAGSAGLGAATPLGAGNGVFLAGAVAILASVTQIRLGGPRQKVVGRTMKGAPLKGPMPSDERRQEIQRGVGLFLLGLAMWAPLLALYVARRVG